MLAIHIYVMLGFEVSDGLAEPRPNLGVGKILLAHPTLDSMTPVSIPHMVRADVRFAIPFAA